MGWGGDDPLRLLPSPRLVLSEAGLDRRRVSLALRVRVVTTETLPAVVPLEPTTPIKPSEAIRLGCLIAPIQIAGAFFGPDGRACALGAALIAWGGGSDNFSPAYAMWAQLDQSKLSCPQCDLGPFAASWIISHLNDNDEHRWSRERIADWLAEQGL